MLKNGGKWWILFVTTTATSIFMLDSTLIPVALPIIQDRLGLSDIAVMWVLNSYLLALTALLLLGGKLSEIFGFRAMFNLGLALFGAGALLCGLSWSVSVLIVARTIQGVGSALAFPASAALLVSVFPPQERARALGIDTGIASLFMIIGPLVGGLFAEYLSWRLIFFFYVPFVIFGLVMSYILVKKSRIVRTSIPIFATILMIVGIVALVIGLMEGNRFGWDHPTVLILTSVGPLLMALFVLISLGSKKPLANFALFKNPLYLGAVSCRFIAYFIVAGTTLWIIYFEKSLQYTPAEIGIFILVAAVPVVGLAPLAGLLADKFWYRLPLIFGFSLLFLGLLWLAIFAHRDSLWILMPGLAAFGLSLPFVMAPTLGLGLTAAPPEQLGGAAGMMMSVRQLASTLGVAMMTAIYYAALKSSDSEAAGFAFINYLAVLLALVAFLVAFFLVRRVHTLIKPHTHR